MSLVQAINFINEGNVFVLYSPTNNNMRAFVKNIKNMDIDTQPMIYLNCDTWPGLLDDGEWDFYLTQDKENSEIMDDEIKKQIANQTSKANKIFYVLG
jgi:hypothetical protein